MAAWSRGLVDVHQIGEGQTGNETWARNVLRTLETDGGTPLHWALTHGRKPSVDVEPTRLHSVSGSSTRRLAIDVPRLLRQLRSEVYMTQYTLPVTRVPGVVVIHDLSFEHPEAASWIPRRSLLRYRLTIGASARRAKVVVAPTEYTSAELISRYRLDGTRVVVAPLALDPELTVRAKRTADRPHLTVLCVGTVLPRKNLPLVARAVSALRARGDDVRLRLVGPLREAGHADLESMQSLLGEGLEVCGAVSTDRLRQEYADADVLAFPSRFEGFGLPLLEAMSAGTPVVCSLATCLPEVAGDAALLVDPLDDRAWVEALSQVLSDASLRERLSRKGLERASSFRWQTTAHQLRSALELAAG